MRALGVGGVYGDGRVDPLNVGLFDQDLARFETQFFHLLFGYRLTVLVRETVSEQATRRNWKREMRHQFLSCSIWLQGAGGFVSEQETH